MDDIENDWSKFTPLSLRPHPIHQQNYAHYAMPMVHPVTGDCLAFNGEIYNHHALRAQLEAEGHVFRSQSDTEVLCHLFEEPDLDRVGRLDGMFAFAAWNAREQTLVLARDYFGKKPLYIAEGDGFLAFASELRALEQLPFLDRTVSRDALAAYLLLQYMPTELAVYEGVVKLDPGDAVAIRLDGSGWSTRHFPVFVPEMRADTRLGFDEACKIL